MCPFFFVPAVPFIISLDTCNSSMTGLPALSLARNSSGVRCREQNPLYLVWAEGDLLEGLEWLTELLEKLKKQTELLKMALRATLQNLVTKGITATFIIKKLHAKHRGLCFSCQLQNHDSTAIIRKPASSRKHDNWQMAEMRGDLDCETTAGNPSPSRS